MPARPNIDFRISRLPHGTLSWLLSALFFMGLWWVTVAARQTVPVRLQQASLSAERLYQLTHLWDIHLRLEPDQWEAMQPAGGSNPPLGRPPGFGPHVPARALASVWMSRADINRDGQITPAEWEAYARQWFLDLQGTDPKGVDSARFREALEALPNPVATGITTLLIGPEGRRNGIAAAFGLEFPYVRADLELGGHRFRNVAIRYKGNGTFLEARDSLKRSFKIQLNHFVPNQRLIDVETLNLQNQITDASYMNEVLAYRLYRDAGVPAPRTAYARVYLTVPGRFDRQYLGLYSMTEAVDRHFLLRHFASRRGALFKPVTSSLFTDLGADWAAYQQIYDPKTPLFAEQKKRLMDLARLVTHADDRTFATRIGHYIDLPQFARFLAVMVYLSDLDGILGPGQNVYLHLHPKTLQFQFIPWDQDRAWGQFDRASQEQRDELSIHHPWQGRNRFLERMFTVPAFTNLYLARLREFSQSLFCPERLARQVDEVARVIRPAVQEESTDKLAAFDRVVAGELLPRRGFGPFTPPPVKPIKPFVEVRTASIRNQLAGTAPGRHPGEGFTMGPPGRRGGSGFGAFTATMLAQLDSDKDGTLTLEEFQAGFVRLFSSWDTNHDRRLRFMEIFIGLQQPLEPSQGSLRPFIPPPPPHGQSGPPPASAADSPPSPPQEREPSRLGSVPRPWLPTERLTPERPALSTPVP